MDDAFYLLESDGKGSQDQNAQGCTNHEPTINQDHDEADAYSQ